MIILKIAGLYLFQRMPEDPNTPTPTESEAWWDEIMEGLEPQPKGPQLSKLIPEEQLEQVLNQQRQEMSLQQIQEQGKQYFGQWDKELPELEILDSDLSEPDQSQQSHSKEAYFDPQPEQEVPTVEQHLPPLLVPNQKQLIIHEVSGQRSPIVVQLRNDPLPPQEKQRTFHLPPPGTYAIKLFCHNW